jgi:RNA polymerase sigma-70 factor (ECF subfamily)
LPFDEALPKYGRDAAQVHASASRLAAFARYPAVAPTLRMAPPPASDPFDPANVERAQAGDDAARDAILTRLQDILRGYFIKRIGPQPEVDDLIQNTLLRVHTGLRDLEKPGSLKAFAMKGALYELQDYYRGRYDMKEYLYDPDLPPPLATGPGAQGAEVDVERALEALTPKARRIIELREYGYRYKEIAQMIDTTEAAIKMQVKRAFERMREALGVVLAGAAGLAGALLRALLGG